MKKYLLMVAAALMTFAACEEKVEPTPDDGGQTTPPAEEVDEITIDPEQKTFAKEGGVQQVMVTSTGEWTLKLDETSEKERAGEWITVKDGVQSGKDGDIVTFEVKENYTGKQLTAVYVFTCGKAEAKFTAVSESGEVNFMTLKSEANVDLKYNAKETTVELSTNINYRAVQVKVAETAPWCKLSFPQEGGSNLVNLVFTLEENTGKSAREAEITITGERVEPITVTLSQRPQTVITVAEEEFFFESKGGQHEIKVEANVEYTFEVTEGADWIKHSTKEPGVEVISADPSAAKRTGKITITEKNPYPGDEPVKVEKVVRQAPESLVKSAIDMTDTRMKPDWEGGNRPGQVWDKKNHYENFTIELLMNADELSKSISTIFGIEGYWLVRLGDKSPTNQIELAGGQVAASWTGEGENYVDKYGENITSDKLQLNAKQWYHLAITFEKAKKMLFSANSMVKFYVDGELIHSGYTYNNPLDLSYVYHQWNNSYPFYFGYSWDDARCFNGKMTEIRLWEKALTSSDLKAKDHFYTVDPKSEGLVAYWKFNEAKMMDVQYSKQYCIPDETGNGFHLICESKREITPGKPLDGTEWTSKAEPKLVPVNLPE